MSVLAIVSRWRSPPAPCNVPVMGIDLGTTNSCVGVWVNGRVEIVPSDQGTRTTPSCVAFTGSERLVGEEANNQVGTNAANTVFDVKRLIGRSFSDASVQSDAKYWPFQVTQGPHDNPRVRVSYLGHDKEFSPEEISAMLLMKMKETAEAYVKRTITDAVITVPVYFNGSQRLATRDAAAIAGLNVLRIVNEPTAAAIAYSFNTNWRRSSVLVYDLGSGTLDVSLVVISNGGLQVIATAGDTHLGGEDFTNNMVDHFVKEFNIKNPDISGDITCDKKAVGRLRRSCEDAKRRLSTNPHIPVEVDALFEGIDLHSSITRDQFEKLNVDLFHRCMVPIVKCLADAKMDRNKVVDVVLVGGSTRIPRLHQLVQGFFGGKALCRNINADEAVAYGATFQAAMIRDDKSPSRVSDITPFSLGIRMMEGIMVLMNRYKIIPAWADMDFTTTEDNQSSLEITVYEVERAMSNKFRLSGIGLAPKGVPKIRVSFDIDLDGILQVEAKEEQEPGVERKITITNDMGRFSMEEIQIMVEEAQRYMAVDEEHKKKIQAWNEIEDLLYTMLNTIRKLQEDQDSAARLLILPPQTTVEKQEKKTARHHQYPASSLGHHMDSKKPKNNTHDKEKKKGIRAPNDTIKKLQEIADDTTKWLENKEHPTSEIIRMKKTTQGAYNRIRAQMESAPR